MMNVRISLPEEDEEPKIRQPRTRNLVPSKKYRDTVKRWGEPTELKRKRVIIVPSVKCPAREVTVTSGAKGNDDDDDDHESDSFTSQVEAYEKRLQERKKLRGILNSCGLQQDWLKNKSGKTELEKRVLKRMLLKGRPEITIKKAPTPTPPEEDDITVTGQDRGVPTIRQPSPAALAVIQEYLEQRRMRLLDLFAQADKDKNWVVSRQEFRNIIRSARIPLTEADVEDLIIALDRDNSDALDYRELAVGRQSYLEERINKQGAEFVQAANGKASKRPETIPEEPEPPLEPLKGDKWSSAGGQRPGSPQRPPSPQRPSSPQLSAALTKRSSTPQMSTALPRRPTSPRLAVLSKSSSSPQMSISPKRPASPQRPLSPVPLQGQSTTSPGQRPDSPNRPGSRSESATSTGSEGVSPTLLEIPAVQLSEKVEQLSHDEIKERRMKKQRQRKQKEKAKQKKKAPEKMLVAPSTLGGTVGEMVDRYRRLTLKEYNDVVQLCQMHGVQLSKALLGRVLLQPEDRPISQMKMTRRQPSLFTISTRHHVPTARTQSRSTTRNQQYAKFRDLGFST